MSTFCISMGGIPIRFSIPFEMEMPREFLPFVVEDQPTQESYTVKLLHEPLRFACKPVFTGLRQEIYPEEDGFTYLFRAMEGPDGCIAACRQRSNGENLIYLPASDLNRYRQKCTFSVLLAAEELLLRHDRLLLHSSVVLHRGQAVLFSGPSGVGKSTQADIWHERFAADIVNGDRTVIHVTPQKCYAFGSPYSGSSGIYRQQSGAIRGIILLRQGAENQLRELRPTEKLSRLYRELIIHNWDEAYVQRVLNLLTTLIATVPIMELCCRPEAAAAELVESMLWRDEHET